MPDSKPKKWWQDFLPMKENGKIDIFSFLIDILASFLMSAVLLLMISLVLWVHFHFDIVKDYPYLFFGSLAIFFVLCPFALSRINNWQTQKEQIFKEEGGEQDEN